MSTDQVIAEVPARVPSAAPGQYLGFGLQTVRMTFHLLGAAADDRVSVEFLDDTAIRYASGSCRVEQAKSALSHNPVSDWSVDLWKTFSTWIKACNAGHLQPSQTEFDLYVSPPHIGNWVGRLHEARSDGEVEAIVADMRKALAALGKIPSTCGEDVQHFLGCDADLRSRIVKRFTFSSSDQDPLDPLRGKLVTVSPEVRDEVVRAAIGWVKEKSDALIRGGVAAEIVAGDFQKWLRSFIKMHDRDHVLASFSHKPDEAAVRGEFMRTYVRQLDAIECTSDEKVRAVSEFLRASADRTLWSERGQVFEPGLREFDEQLAEHWSVTGKRNAILYGQHSNIERGKLLLYDCVSHQTKLGGRDIPAHIVPGTFHDLAERVIVGWHPQYEKLFKN